jgi:hypothetical protein
MMLRVNESLAPSNTLGYRSNHRESNNKTRQPREQPDQEHAPTNDLRKNDNPTDGDRQVKFRRKRRNLAKFEVTVKQNGDAHKHPEDKDCNSSCSVKSTWKHSDAP